MTRRNVMQLFGAAILSITTGVLAGPLLRAERRQLRRMRRRIRRRIRRRVFFRSIHGRRFLVVPVAIAAGWELQIDKEVVVVKEVRVIKKDGLTSETIVTTHPDGTEKEYPVVREDNQDNSVELEGSELSQNEQEIPHIESEAKDSR